MAHPSFLLETVAFFDLLNWPLTKNELFRLTHESPDRLPFSLVRSENFICLQGREDLILKRRAKEKKAAFLWAKTRRFVSWLSFFPFVEAVFVALQLAFNGVDEQSDIDLFVVVKKGRLWFTRWLVSCWFLLLGQKRQGKKIAGRFCLNFFVTEEALDLSQVALPGGDPYLAYWSYLLVPVFDSGILPRLVTANSWLKGRFPWYGISSYSAPLVRFNFGMKAIKATQEFFFYLVLGPLWEGWLRFFQRKRIERKQKTPFPLEIMSDAILKFHPEARSVFFQERLPAKLISLRNEDS